MKRIIIALVIGLLAAVAAYAISVAIASGHVYGVRTQQPSAQQSALQGTCTIGGTDFGDTAQTDWSLRLSNPGTKAQMAGSYVIVFYAGSREIRNDVVNVDTLIMPGQRMTFPQDPFYTDGSTSCVIAGGA